MKLTNNEIRHINRYLEEGKPLPEKHRFLLFENKREIELVWNGKTSGISCGHSRQIRQILNLTAIGSEKIAKKPIITS